MKQEVMWTMIGDCKGDVAGSGSGRQSPGKGRGPLLTSYGQTNMLGRSLQYGEQ